MSIYKKISVILLFSGLFLSTHKSFAVNVDTQDVVLGPSGGSYNRYYSMDNVPFIYNTSDIIADINSRKIIYSDNQQHCAGLDAKIDLPIVGSINGYSIYKLTEYIGIIISVGALHNPPPMNGSHWVDVVHQECSSSIGYSVYLNPVILKRSYTKSFNIPLTQVGRVRLRAMDGTVFTGKTEFTFSINNSTIISSARSCTLLTPANMTINLPTISTMSIPNAGDELFAGMMSIRLNCEPGVTVYATLTDASAPSNRSDLLSLTSTSTASGIGLKIYKNDDATALRFGPDSPIKGNENQWRLSSGTESSPFVQLKVKYANTGSSITPGTVNGISTITFSYQ